MAISIGDALLKIGIDKTDFDKGMDGIGSSIQKHQKSIAVGMMAVGGAIIGAAAMSLKAYADMGDEVQKMALRTGWAAESLSELRHVAAITGTELNAFEKGTRRMAGAILDANDGLETYTRSFDKLGLDYRALKEMKPEEAFWAITDALSKLDNELEKAAIAQDIFGRTGTQLLPMLAEGADGIQRLREEAHELGIVFDQEAAEKAAEFTDNMQRLKDSVDGVKLAIAENLLPTADTYVRTITSVITGMRTWSETNSVLSSTLIGFGTTLGGVSLTLGGILFVLPKITLALRALGMGAGFASLAMGGLAIGITAVVWALSQIYVQSQDAARAQELQTQAMEEAEKAANGEANALREVLEEAKSLGYVLNEESEAWLASSQATENDTVKVEANIASRARLTQIVGSNIQAIQALVNLYGAAGGFTPEQWEKILPTLTKMKQKELEAQGRSLPGMQHGGIIPEPTLLTSLRTMRPYAVAGERGTEVVSPAGSGYRTANIYFQVDGRTMAKVIGQPLVDEIRLQTGAHI